MKKITITVDEETYRLAEVVAAKRKASVSGLLEEYLKNLTAGVKDTPQVPGKTISEVVADLRARGVWLSVSDNVPREELYDRDALR